MIVGDHSPWGYGNNSTLKNIEDEARTFALFWHPQLKEQEIDPLHLKKFQ